ncbi:hypothetical protein IV102_01895 [bacterium]|nr:hypothetical protein [bacterium]
MAKKRKPHAPAPQRLNSPELIEAELERQRKGGNFTKALECARELGPYRTGPQLALLTAGLQHEWVESFLERGRFSEAKRKIEEFRSPERDQSLECLAARVRGLEGDWDGLLQEWMVADNQQRLAVEEAIRCELVDLSKLAHSRQLPLEHPLRCAAAQLEEAFQRATSHPDVALKLPELSRRSPLSGWRLFIQAVHAFYRCDDDLCRRFVSGIPAGSAVLRGAVILEAALQGKVAPPLARQLNGGHAELRAALAQLDADFGRRAAVGKLADRVRQTLGLVQQSAPQLLDSFRQRVFVTVTFHQLDITKFAQLIYPMPVTASFWREWARGLRGKDNVTAVCCWEEYRHHARAESLLSPLEESALLVFMAETLENEDANSQDLKGRAGMLHQMYSNQSASVRAISPVASSGKLRSDYLNIEKMYHRACSLHPHPEAFISWLKWEGLQTSGQPENAAEAWLKHHPRDPRPLLELVEIYESKKMTGRAQAFLIRALEADRLNPRLLEAQMRLAVANLCQHLKKGKIHLLAPQFATLEASPLMKQPHRLTLLAALRCLEADAVGSKAAPARLEQLSAELGSRALALHLLKELVGVKFAGRLKITQQAMNLGTRDVLVLPQLAQLSTDLRADWDIPEEWEGTLILQLTKLAKQIESPQLVAICRAALEFDLLELAYSASGLGLKRPLPWPARFLFYRALSLPEWNMDGWQECLAAAYQLALEQGDSELQREILAEAADQELHPGDLAMPTYEAQAILKGEARAKKYPSGGEWDDAPDLVAMLSQILSGQSSGRSQK